MICEYCGANPDHPVLNRWEVFIPLEPPSQNQIASANRGDWKKRAEYRSFRDSYTFYLTSWRNKQKIPLPSTKRRVVFTRFYSRHGQLRDKGNLIGGMKSLLDAMVGAHLLADDKPQDVEDFYHQIRGTESGVRIVLEELSASQARSTRSKSDVGR
jgi:Holliday junction resolvase RusA-like endonuclease